jgi:hypothetical protein
VRIESIARVRGASNERATHRNSPRRAVLAEPGRIAERSATAASALSTDPPSLA